MNKNNRNTQSSFVFSLKMIFLKQTCILFFLLVYSSAYSQVIDISGEYQGEIKASSEPEPRNIMLYLSKEGPGKYIGKIAVNKISDEAYGHPGLKNTEYDYIYIQARHDTIQNTIRYTNCYLERAKWYSNRPDTVYHMELFPSSFYYDLYTMTWPVKHNYFEKISDTLGKRNNTIEMEISKKGKITSQYYLNRIDKKGGYYKISLKKIKESIPEAVLSDIKKWAYNQIEITGYRVKSKAKDSKPALIELDIRNKGKARLVYKLKVLGRYRSLTLESRISGIDSGMVENKWDQHFVLKENQKVTIPVEIKVLLNGSQFLEKDSVIFKAAYLDSYISTLGIPVKEIMELPKKLLPDKKREEVIASLFGKNGQNPGVFPERLDSLVLSDDPVAKLWKCFFVSKGWFGYEKDEIDGLALFSEVSERLLPEMNEAEVLFLYQNTFPFYKNMCSPTGQAFMTREIIKAGKGKSYIHERFFDFLNMLELENDRWTKQKHTKYNFSKNQVDAPKKWELSQERDYFYNLIEKYQKDRSFKYTEEYDEKSLRYTGRIIFTSQNEFYETYLEKEYPRSAIYMFVNMLANDTQAIFKRAKLLLDQYAANGDMEARIISVRYRLMTDTTLQGASIDSMATLLNGYSTPMVKSTLASLKIAKGDKTGALALHQEAAEKGSLASLIYLSSEEIRKPHPENIANDFKWTIRLACKGNTAALKTLCLLSIPESVKDPIYPFHKFVVNQLLFRSIDYLSEVEEEKEKKRNQVSGAEFWTQFFLRQAADILIRSSEVIGTERVRTYRNGMLMDDSERPLYNGIIGAVIDKGIEALVLVFKEEMKWGAQRLWEIKEFNLGQGKNLVFGSVSVNGKIDETLKPKDRIILFSDFAQEWRKDVTLDRECKSFLFRSDRSQTAIAGFPYNVYSGTNANAILVRLNPRLFTSYGMPTQQFSFYRYFYDISYVVLGTD